MTCGLSLSRIGAPGSAGLSRAKDANDLSGGKTPYQIIVVDDDNIVRSTTLRMLRYEGFEVIEAASGKEALERMVENPGIKIAVIDIVMPEMTGLALAARLTAVAPRCRVILMTGYAPDMTDLGKRAAHFPLLMKPFTTNQLLQQIRAVVTGSSH